MNHTITPMLVLCLLWLPIRVTAEWQVLLHNNIDKDKQIRIANIQNNEGYELDVYKDDNHAVRLRFNVGKTQDRLLKSHCPSYQVDAHPAQNVSVNQAQCLSNAKWAEYILGYIIDDEIQSDLLHTIKNGIRVHYRFILEEGLYKETQFTLLGSSRALSEALSHSSYE